MQQKRFLRSAKDKMIGGVCGGLGEYFKIDSNIVRLLFVAFTFLGGSGVLVYIILWIVVPEEGKTSYFQDVADGGKEKKAGEKVKGAAEKFATEVKSAVRNKDKKDGSLVFALILIFVGIIFLANNFIPFSHILKLWPLILIIIGLSILFSQSERS